MVKDWAKDVRRALGAALVVGLLCSASASACAFHAALPERTAADWILESDHLVLARPTAANPYLYEVVGTLRDAGREVRIGQFVDAATRLKLAANPRESVLFGYHADEGGWRRIAHVDADFEEVLQRLLDLDGTAQETYSPERFAIFAALVDHPDRTLQDLALQELDKAPYALLRAHDWRLPTDRFLAEIWSLQGFAYQPIRVMLLGLEGKPEARLQIEGYLRTASAWSRADAIGPFAVALIEMDGRAGLDVLETLYFSDPSQDLAKLDRIVGALAVHRKATDDARLSAEITRMLERFVAGRPEAAPLVARNFLDRSDWSQAAYLEDLVRERRLASLTDLASVAIYVAHARDAMRATSMATSAAAAFCACKDVSCRTEAPCCCADSTE